MRWFIVAFKFLVEDIFGVIDDFGFDFLLSFTEFALVVKADSHRREVVDVDLIFFYFSDVGLFLDNERSTYPI